MSNDKVINFGDIKSEKSKNEESKKKLKNETEKDNLSVNKKSKINFKNICFLAVIIIIIFYPLAYVGNQLVTLTQFESNIEALKSELEETKIKSKNIQSEIDGAKSNEFIEKMAREQLKMVKKGEIVYVKIE